MCQFIHYEGYFLKNVIKVSHKSVDVIKNQPKIHSILWNCINKLSVPKQKLFQICVTILSGVHTDVGQKMMIVIPHFIPFSPPTSTMMERLRTLSSRVSQFMTIFMKLRGSSLRCIFAHWRRGKSNKRVTLTKRDIFQEVYDSRGNKYGNDIIVAVLMIRGS